MRLHRTDNLRLIAQFAITTISRPESAIGPISQGATLDEPSPTVTATVYLACCW
jgi:hypothetical protein